MRVRIDRTGWDSYTGDLSGVPFVNGISTRELNEREIARIGANIRIVGLEDDKQVGPTTEHKGHIEAPTVVNSVRASDEEVVVETTAEVFTEVNEPVSDAPDRRLYTKEELIKIADDGGIKAIRDIAKEYDVKGVQIAQLIQGILQAQVNTEAE